MLVTVGTKGKYSGAIGVFPDVKRRTRFELVTIDDRFEESEQIRTLLDEKYLQELASLKLVEKYPKIPFDPAQPDIAFVGSDTCSQCHPTVYQRWKGTKHAGALDTLVEGHEQKWKKVAGGKHVNPECIVCHKVEGLTAAPQGHLSEDDEVCLACHAHRSTDPGRLEIR